MLLRDSTVHDDIGITMDSAIMEYEAEAMSCAFFLFSKYGEKQRLYSIQYYTMVFGCFDFSAA